MRDLPIFLIAVVWVVVIWWLGGWIDRTVKRHNLIDDNGID